MSVNDDIPAGDDELPPDDNRTLAQLVVDITSQASVLIREEIELAKTEITEKITKLLRGSVVAIVAGIFALLGFAMLMHAFAWFLNDLFFEDAVWLGFLIEALIWFLIAGIAGFWAYRSFQAGSPPVPDMAIEEAKLIGQTFSGEDNREGEGPSAAKQGPTGS